MLAWRPRAASQRRLCASFPQPLRGSLVPRPPVLTLAKGHSHHRGANRLGGDLAKAELVAVAAQRLDLLREVVGNADDGHFGRLDHLVNLGHAAPVLVACHAVHLVEDDRLSTRASGLEPW